MYNQLKEGRKLELKWKENVMQEGAARKTTPSPIFNIVLTINLRKTGKLWTILNRTGNVVPLTYSCFEKIILLELWRNGSC